MMGDTRSAAPHAKHGTTPWRPSEFLEGDRPISGSIGADRYPLGSGTGAASPPPTPRQTRRHPCLQVGIGRLGTEAHAESRVRRAGTYPGDPTEAEVDLLGKCRHNPGRRFDVAPAAGTVFRAAAP